MDAAEAVPVFAQNPATVSDAACEKNAKSGGGGGVNGVNEPGAANVDVELVTSSASVDSFSDVMAVNDDEADVEDVSLSGFGELFNLISSDVLDAGSNGLNGAGSSSENASQVELSVDGRGSRASSETTGVTPATDAVGECEVLQSISDENAPVISEKRSETAGEDASASSAAATGALDPADVVSNCGDGEQSSDAGALRSTTVRLKCSLSLFSFLLFSL
jgi:hypothetical protein